MKTKYIIALCLSFFWVSTFVFGQQTTDEGIPIVKIENEKVVGALPYGEDFKIRGSALLANGQIADSVEVLIFKTDDKYRFWKRVEDKDPSDKTKKTLTAGGDESNNFVSKSVWVKFRNPDAKQFETYFNTPLQFGRKYIVKINYYRRYRFIFSEMERSQIINFVVEKAAEQYNENGVISNVDVRDHLNYAVTAAMRNQVEARGEVFYGFGKSLNDNPVVTANSLNILTNSFKTNSNLIDFAADKGDLKDYQEQLRQARQDLEKANENAEKATDENAKKRAQIAINQANTDIATAKEDIARVKESIAESEKNLPAILNIIKNQLALVSISEAAGSSAPSSVAKLDAIRIGTTIGGGGIFFNPQDADLRQVRPVAYSALKLYLLPVDKTVVDPYLTDYRFLNRISMIVGVATSGSSYVYRGQELIRPLGIGPVLGLSYDISPYFNVDIATTVFEQSPQTGLLNKGETRFAPVLGMTFDLDVFNRIKSLSNGNQYNARP